MRESFVLTETADDRGHLDLEGLEIGQECVGLPVDELSSNGCSNWARKSGGSNTEDNGDWVEDLGEEHDGDVTA